MDPFKQEALRLVSELIDAAHGTVLNEDQSREDEVRAALLAHIQRGASAVVPGVMHCARCKFRLQRVNLHVNNGTVGAGDNAPESCPNGCGPLWPVTWEQEAREGYKLTEDLFERAKRAEDALEDMRKQAPAPAPAEVPMPGPVAYGFGNTAITGHKNRLMMVRLDVPLDDQYAGALWLPLVLADEARTYGERCRAAGEAAGYARGLEEGVARTGLTPAEHDVMAERQRQISAEGWTPEHDDEHDDGSLAAAAACYALGDQAGEIPAGWPQSWDESWWRPSAGERRNLVKAGALILAEIERLDRAALRGEVKP